MSTKEIKSLILELWNCTRNLFIFILNQYIIKFIFFYLCRNELHEEMINIDFEDVAKRLTEDKIKEVFFFEYLAKASKSIMDLLDTVFIY